MNHRSVLRAACSLLLALYPEAWRARYRDEVEDVLDQHRVTTSTVLDLAAGAVHAHRHPDLVAANQRSPATAPRSRVTSLTTASLLFAVGWAASLRIGYWTGFWIHDQDNPLRIGVRLVYALGAASLLALTAATIALFLATTVRGRASGPGGSVRWLALAGPLTAAGGWLVATALAPRVDASASWAMYWYVALVPWAVAMVAMSRSSPDGSTHSTAVHRALMLGRLGALGMAASLAAGIATTVGVALVAPQLGAPGLAVAMMAAAVAWAGAGRSRAAGLRGGRGVVA
jgi:hypothetical protein